jgi:hypothetical protein
MDPNISAAHSPMQNQVFEISRALIAIAAGTLIGYAFGLFQAVARRRAELREREGKLKSGWSLMPGAGARVAYFLVVLVGIQLVCPLLFADGTQWIVSGGVVAGYGWTLYRELRRRVAADRAAR